MPTRIQHWRNQFMRNATMITASLIVAAVTGVLYLKYIVAAAAFYGVQGTLIGLPIVF